MENNDKKTPIPQSRKAAVSDSSLKIILECLNSSLKYGRELMINADEDDVNLGLELWRKNEAISLAIKEVENYRQLDS
jgi:hypothetical protein